MNLNFKLCSDSEFRHWTDANVRYFKTLLKHEVMADIKKVQPEVTCCNRRGGPAFKFGYRRVHWQLDRCNWTHVNQTHCLICYTFWSLFLRRLEVHLQVTVPVASRWVARAAGAGGSRKRQRASLLAGLLAVANRDSDRDSRPKWSRSALTPQTVWRPDSTRNLAALPLILSSCKSNCVFVYEAPQDSEGPPPAARPGKPEVPNHAIQNQFQAVGTF